MGKVGGFFRALRIFHAKKSGGKSPNSLLLMVGSTKNKVGCVSNRKAKTIGFFFLIGEMNR